MTDSERNRNDEARSKPDLELPITDTSFKTALPQILATMAKNLTLLGYGMTLGFPTIVIPSLQGASSTDKLSLTDEQISWFSSINLITVPLGCIVSGVVTQPLGRKRAMQYLMIPFLVTWIIFHYANSIGMLYASLALTGLAGGLLEAPVLTYVAEITQPHVRGVLSASSSLAVILGMFTQFLMGSFINWRTLSMVNTAAPILAFIGLCFIPESPHWLIGRNRLEEAEKSLCWLRGWVKPQQIQHEYRALMRLLRPDIQVTDQLKVVCITEDKVKPVESSDEEAKQNRCLRNVENYKKRTFIIPFLLVGLAFLTGHFSGMTTLTTFAVNIFATLGAPIDKYFATMILGVVQLLATLICALLIHYTGKRPLVFVSTFGAALFFAGVGIYAHYFLGISKLDNGAYVQEHAEVLSSMSWVPMTCLIGGSFFSYLALRLIPWILIGEIYPSNVRALASGASASIGYILGFASNKTFFTLIEKLTLPGVYVFYGAVGLISCMIFYFYLPETEGWSLHEIEDHFAGTISLIKAGRKKTSKAKKSEGIDNPCEISDQVSKL